MGRLIKGKWVEEVVNPETDDGEFQRQKQAYRHTLESLELTAQDARFHLYVSYACPWAHRTLIVRALKGLEECIPVHVVHPHMLGNGWSFQRDFPGSTGDENHGLSYLKDLYVKSDSDFTGRVTVPVLYDTKTQKIVNNESADLVRMLNSEWNELAARPELDLFPENLRDGIEDINTPIYDNINNGVYKTGFARTQKAYQKNHDALFEQLAKTENHLDGKTYLVGETLTEADIRLYTTLVRFDAVYHTHFKCNFKKIAEFPNLQNYLERLYAKEAFHSTTHFDHIKEHYYYSHETLNPFRLVPPGPELSWAKT